MKRRTQLIGLLSLLLAAGGASVSFQWWQRQQIRQSVRTSRPALPPLTGRPRELVTRITDADQRVHSGREIEAGLVELSRLYDANGFVSEAAQCYQLLMQVEPSVPRWPHLLAMILAGYGRLDEAWPLWQRTAKLAPDYAPAGIRLGDALLKLNEFEPARAAYEKVMQLPGDHPHALVGLARVDLHFGRCEAAQEKLERAVMQTNFQIGADLLTTVYEETNQASRALEIRSRSKSSGSFSDIADPWADDLFSDCYDVYRLQVAGGVAEHRGDEAVALNLLKRALTLAPNDTATLFQLGGYYLRKKKPAEARGYFQRCVALHPDFPDGWAQLIGMQRSSGDESGASRMIEEALAHCPKSPGLHLEKARILAAANQTEAAIREFRETIRLRPEEADPYVALAGICFERNQVDEGIKELRAALKAEPGNPVALSTLAYAIIGMGDENEARDILEQIRQQPRTPPGAWRALSAAYQEKFGRPFR